MLAVGIVVGAEDSFESSGRLSDMLTGMPTVHTALWFGFKSRFSVQCEMGFSLETSCIVEHGCRSGSTHVKWSCLLPSEMVWAYITLCLPWPSFC